MSSSAFAHLFEVRRAELGMAVGDIADALEVDVVQVTAWSSGDALPAAAAVDELAGALSLPRSLVREALRRSQLEEIVGDGDTDEEIVLPAPEDLGQVGATIESAVVTVVDPRDPVTAEAIPARSRVVGLARTPFEALRARLQRRRELARAPTERASYLEDRRQLLTYRIRAVLTAGAVIALALLLRWALSGFGSSLSELWDALTGAL